MVVPEKSDKVRKFIIPNYIVKGTAVSIAFVLILAVIMVLDYANVMNQITENKKLHVENRQLRQAVQVFKDKMVTIESTMDRVKTFSTKLRIITNIEEAPTSISPVPPPPSLPFPTSPNTNPVAPNSSKVQPNSSSIAIPTTTPIAAKEIDSSNGMEADTDAEADDELLNAFQTVVRDEVAERALRKEVISALMVESPESLTLSETDTSLFVKSEFEKLNRAYEVMKSFTELQEFDIQHTLERLGEKRAILAGTPTRLPTLGYVTSEYGVRISPYDTRRKMHEGIDIANRYGADVISPANGLVTFAGIKAGYGKVVILDHGNGLETYFAHLSRNIVKQGVRVKRGQIIASVGSSGHSTGPHLHYEVRANGLPVDPCWYILDQPTVCRMR